MSDTDIEIETPSRNNRGEGWFRDRFHDQIDKNPMNDGRFKTTDIGEKLDLLDVVFTDDGYFQPAVIARKGAVLGWR